MVKNIYYKKYLVILLSIGMLFSAEGDIIITEIFYESSNNEINDYIELYNRTSVDVLLDGW